MKQLILKIKNAWPFAPKKEVVFNPPWWSECQEFFAKQKIGTTFPYLGREMLFTGTRFDFHTLKPYIVCEYADNNGKLHEWVFTTSMLPLVQQSIQKKLDS